MEPPSAEHQILCLQIPADFWRRRQPGLACARGPQGGAGQTAAHPHLLPLHTHQTRPRPGDHLADLQAGTFALSV